MFLCSSCRRQTETKKLVQADCGHIFCGKCISLSHINEKSFCPCFDRNETETTPGKNEQTESNTTAALVVQTCQLQSEVNKIRSTEEEKKDALTKISKDFETWICKIEKVEEEMTTCKAEMEVMKKTTTALQAHLEPIKLAYGKDKQEIKDRIDKLEEVRKKDSQKTSKDHKITSYYRNENCDHTNSLIATHIWKLENFTQLQKDCLPNFKVCSNEFFSYPFGYKMRGRLYPNGTRDAADTHLSVYLQIVPGPWDDLLYWPATFDVKIALVYQGEKVYNPGLINGFDEVKEFSVYDYRPTTGTRNTPIGCEEFMPLSDLLVPAYLDNDTLYIKYEITF